MSEPSSSPLEYSPDHAYRSDRTETCDHYDGCDEQEEWIVEFGVDREGEHLGRTKFGYCDDHVEAYFGYHPDGGGS